LKVIKEARIDCVPKLFDIYEDATFISLIMEYKEYPNLLTWMKENPDLTEAKGKMIFDRLCNSLK